MNRFSSTAVRDIAVAQEDIRRRPRMAVLGSPGLAYLRGLLCAASIKQGFDVDLFAGSYASYADVLADQSSTLFAFRPDIVLVTVDGAFARATCRSGDVGTSAHWAKQQFGAALIRNAVLPALMPKRAQAMTGANAPSLSFLDAMEQKLGGRLARTGKHALIEGSVPPIWRRRKSSAASALLEPFPAGRTFAALFGVAYSCVVVEAAQHPYMKRRDIGSFLLHWEEMQGGHSGANGLTGCPDSFLFVDSQPFGQEPARRR